MLGSSAAAPFAAFSFLHIPGQRGKKSVASSPGVHDTDVSGLTLPPCCQLPVVSGQYSVASSSRIRQLELWPSCTEGSHAGQCHPEPFACHSERSEESRSAAQGKLREEPVLNEVKESRSGRSG